LEESTQAPNPDEERVLERLSQDDAVSALSAVPHDLRDAIVLVDIGDFSYNDAAQILDIPVGTVMSRLHRGRRILKRELAERAVTDGGDATGVVPQSSHATSPKSCCSPSSTATSARRSGWLRRTT